MKRLLALALAALFCVSLAACGQENKEDGKSGSSAASSSDASSKAETSSKTDDASKDDGSSKAAAGKSLKDYAEQVKKAGLPSDNDTLDIDIYTDGNTFVYEFKYKEQIADDTLSAVKTSLDKSLENSANTYNSVVDEIKDYTGLDATVKVVYKNADGKVISEKEYVK